MALHRRNLKTSHLLLAALFTFSFLLGLSFISKGPYHPDCLYFALQSQKILQTHHIHYLHGLGFPLTALSGAFFIGALKFFGIHDPVWSVNFMSVLFGALDVAVLYLCVEKLFGTKAACYSGLFLSINPLFLSLSTFGNTHILAAFFFLAGLYFLFAYFQNPSQGTLILSGLCLGLFGAARLQDLIGMSLPLLFLFLFPPGHLYKPKEARPKGRKVLKDLLILALFCLAALCLFYVPSLAANKEQLTTNLFYGSVKRQFLAYLAAPSLGLVLERLATFLSCLSPVEWLGIAVGFVYLFKTDRRLGVFLLLSVCLYFLLYGDLIFAINRHFVLVLIPFVIAESYALSLLPQQKTFWRVSIPAVFIVLLILNLTRYSPILAFRHSNAWLPDFFTWAGEQTEPDAYIIERDHSLFIEHYAHRKPLAPDIKLYRQGPEILEEFKEHLDGLLKEGTPVYITKYGILYRPSHGFTEFMLRHYSFEHVGSRFVEDWHKGCLKQVLVKNDLLRIRPLPSSP